METLGASCGRYISCQRQGALKPGPSVVEVAAHPPEFRQVSTDAQGYVRLPPLARPAEGGPQVVVLGLELVSPSDLVDLVQMGCRSLGQGQKKGGMPFLDVIFLLACRQLRQSELPDRLQHPVAW